MSKQNLDIAYFVSFCIEQYKTSKNLNGEQALAELQKYGVIEYLESNFEPLHTQSRQWILEDIDAFINLRRS